MHTVVPRCQCSWAGLLGSERPEGQRSRLLDGVDARFQEGPHVEVVRDGQDVERRSGGQLRGAGGQRCQCGVCGRTGGHRVRRREVAVKQAVVAGSCMHGAFSINF